MFYFYILRSVSSGAYYIGSCEDLQGRIKRHNSGLVKSTKHHSPWELVHNEKYPTLSKARKRESQVKNWKKRLAIERLIKHF